MESPSKLPMDVLGYIADTLGAEIDTRLIPSGIPNGHAVQALKMLCLTCKFMVAVCRRHLFAKISLSSFSSLKRVETLSEFLLSHPIIPTRYVKILYLDTSRFFSPSDYDLLQKLCGSSSLTSINISTTIRSPAYWNTMPEQKKSAFLSLFQIPTLRHLALVKIVNFPAAAFSLCCGLTNLVLHEMSNLAPPAPDNRMHRPKITTLVAWHSIGEVHNTIAALMNPTGHKKAEKIHSIIAFAHLQDASVNIETDTEGFQTCKLLEEAVRLEKLHIQAYASMKLLPGIFSSLAANPHPKLRYLKLDFGFSDGDCDNAFFNGLHR
ncbi:hypothetical protein HYPSUDRAFT_49605 [Hypholoma sublateritium FD-334 SS-4]|uniref:F-box domain-containing protein n=1 Tax=Hypholoma sublateritium (strain FD-334 SS-4) TaxID=945553 RepID=A0A0D2N3I1_HYPSF|nr:hypothetical protein HYPSUDRAFT_49605 [Hypholoma sublateritium FD-334 SS-4]